MKSDLVEIVLWMFVGSRLAFALMTADLDANLVSRNILIPLLLSEFRIASYYFCFSKSLRKIHLGVCYLPPFFLLLLSLSVLGHDMAVNIRLFIARWIPCFPLSWRVLVGVYVTVSGIRNLSRARPRMWYHFQLIYVIKKLDLTL